MKNKISPYITFFLLGLSLLTGCQEECVEPYDVPPTDQTALLLSGQNGPAIQVNSRAPQAKFFPVNTHYRIWMDGWDAPSKTMEPRFCAVGHDILENQVHYIKFQTLNVANTPTNEAPLKFDNNNDILDFYGLTDPAQKFPAVGNTPAYADFIQSYLPKDATASEEEPTYTLRRQHSLPEGSIETDTLPDIRYAVQKGCTRQNTGLILPLPFKHILSKVNFEIVQQVNKNADKPHTPVFPDLAIIGVKVLDQPQEGIFNIRKGQFQTIGTASNPAFQVKMNLPQGQNAMTITTKPQRVGSTLLFPMLQEPVEPIKVTVTLKGKYRTLRQFTTNPRTDLKRIGNTNDYKLDLTLPVYSNNHPNSVQNKPLKLDPNYEYDIQFMIMNNDVRIVTIVPQVYPWIDGENDKNNLIYGGYEEQDMGQPVTFNGVVWSDRNLGASSANPLRSIKDWQKSVGYYYQFDRNIPYFPNNFNEVNGKIDLETPLDIAFGGNAERPLYPVVNFNAWEEVNKLPTKNQLIPSNNDSYQYVSHIGELPKGSGPLSWGMALHNQKGKAGLWKDPSTQPCPKGWRIPTFQDFMGILPGSVLAGNITFREFYNRDNSGGFQVINNGNMHNEPDFPTDFKEGGIGMEMYNLGLSLLGPNQKAYLGNYPCIYREEANDPQIGSKSQYVLSMYGEDRQCILDKSNKYGRNEDYVFNFGTIYGIKHVGTAKAYRIKWEIKWAGQPLNTQVDIQKATRYCKNPNTTMYKGKYGTQYQGLYGVLVISRYNATASDNFNPINNSYQWVAKKKSWWEHPVEVLYLPICGGAGNWQKGKLFNLGAEGWYATSEDNPSNKNHKRMIWFKIAGDNSSNQALYDSNSSPKMDVVSIRCVRNH